MAVEARREEMAFFRRMGVYHKVPRSQASKDGCKVITTRWIDTNKGTNEKPNYRARLVGREIKTDSRIDLFAATPPLESLRMMCSLCASNQNRSRPFRIMAVDVKRAYFYAKAQRPMYIEIPIEDFQDGDEGMIGKLDLSLYGARDAAQNWAKEYASHLQRFGFRAGLASPCNFMHKARELSVTVHGDDFTVAGPENSLVWFKGIMENKYEIKASMLGPEAHMSQTVRILNRILGWSPEGITYQPDGKHAEMIIQELGLSEGNAVSTPALADSSSAVEERANSPKMAGNEASSYRGLAARLNYLALDRPDLQFAATSASRFMADPRNAIGGC